MEWFLRLFKWERPIARLEYFLSSLGFSLILSVIMALVSTTALALSLGKTVAYLLCLPFILAGLYVSYLLVVKRIWDLIGDLKNSFIWAIGLFVISCIPLINLVALVGYLMLLFCPSDQFKKAE